MLLMTKELEKKFEKYPLYSQEEKKELHHLLVLRLNENNMSLAVK